MRSSTLDTVLCGLFYFRCIINLVTSSQLNTKIMATKLVPTPVGIPGKQLDIFDEIVNNEESKSNVVYRQPVQPIPPVKPIETPKPQSNQRGTFQSFRL